MERKKQNWQMISGVCGTPGAEGTVTYGVRVECPDGTAWEWADVDVEPAVVSRLLARMDTAQPEPCHFQELVLDFIEETAAPLQENTCFYK